MARRLNKLHARPITALDSCRPHRPRNVQLRDADRARVGVVRRAVDVKLGQGEGVILRLLSNAQVDVDEGCLVALEPPGLEGDGAARDGPVGAVGGWGDAAAFLTGITFGQRCWPSRVGGELTRIHPLHSKGKGCIRDEVVGSPAWVGDNHMRLGDMCQYSCENEQHSVSSSSDRGRYG